MPASTSARRPPPGLHRLNRTEYTNAIRDVLGLEVTERGNASLAAAALGIARGCRIVRVHDVAATVKVRDVLDAILKAAPTPEREGGADQPDGGEASQPTAPRPGGPR